MTCKDFSRKFNLALALIGFVSLATFGCLPGPAAGADFQQPFPELVPPDDRVEFASNWYVRGDIAYARETYPNITPTFGLTPSVLNTYSVGAGFGYKVNDWFRTDLILDYRSRVHTAGIGDPVPCAIATGFSTCFFDTTIQRWDLLANGYLDLGTWEGFTPYIGAGAGVTWARIWQNNGLEAASNTHYQFAWAAMAGVAFAIAEHVQLDVGYRFLDLGHISGIPGVTGIPGTKNIIVNEVRGGLRYMID